MVLKSAFAWKRSRSADLFWLIMMIGAAYAAWVEKSRLSRMKGYGSQRCETTSITFRIIHIATRAVCTMMNVHEPMPAATASAMR